MADIPSEIKKPPNPKRHHHTYWTPLTDSPDGKSQNGARRDPNTTKRRRIYFSRAKLRPLAHCCIGAIAVSVHFLLDLDTLTFGYVQRPATCSTYQEFPYRWDTFCHGGCTYWIQTATNPRKCQSARNRIWDSCQLKFCGNICLSLEGNVGIPRFIVLWNDLIS